ncbi:MAG: hypothetical protein SGARI_007377, partial [Bacillariaceae sp.]
MLQNYWELSTSSPNDGSMQHTSGLFQPTDARNLKVQSPADFRTKVNQWHNSSAEQLPPKSNNNNTLSRLTLPYSWHHLAVLEKQTNISYIDSLVHALQNRSKVYFPGTWDGAGIVIQEYKLVLFTQGKVACTVFKQLARRMMHINDWRKHAEPNIPHNPKHNGLVYLYPYKMPDALTILTSPEWTRAIFVRDPKERTLSA